MQNSSSREGSNLAPSIVMNAAWLQAQELAGNLKGCLAFLLPRAKGHLWYMSIIAGSRMTLEVQDSSSGEVSHLAPGILVNAAGLQAQEIAGRLKGLPAQHVPKRHLARGCYFSLKGDDACRAFAQVSPARTLLLP